MERRDFLKGAAALPAMAAIPGFVGTAGASEVAISEKQAWAICVFTHTHMGVSNSQGQRIFPVIESALGVLYNNTFVLRYPELFNTEQTIPMSAPTMLLTPKSGAIAAMSRAYHAEDADGCMEELASFVRTWHAEGRTWYPYVPIVPLRSMSGKTLFKTRYGLSEA